MDLNNVLLVRGQYFLRTRLALYKRHTLYFNLVRFKKKKKYFPCHHMELRKQAKSFQRMTLASLFQSIECRESPHPPASDSLLDL